MWLLIWYLVTERRHREKIDAISKHGIHREWSKPSVRKLDLDFKRIDQINSVEQK
jgi:hypothetical protein